MNQKFSTIHPAGPARTMSLDALRSFVAIHDTGSFRHAAARVSLSPSAVSLQIGKLEEVLGYRLLERNARRVALTEHGELLLPQARHLLSLNDETLTLFRGSALEGRLTLAAPHDLGISLVPALLRRVAERYPRIRVDVRLGASAEVRNGFSAGQSDVVLFNEVGSPAVAARKIWSEPLVWLMARGGRAASDDPLPLAVAAAGCTWRAAALKALDASGRSYRIAYDSDTLLGQAAALRADLAVAPLPLSLAQGELVEVPKTAGLPALPRIHIRVSHHDGELANAVVAMVEEVARARQSRQFAGLGDAISAHARFSA
ncbi:LysR substrate-binding domain-containing protein [Chelatococcus reniformis]|uniref:Transcriptional regulator n=1 Tax=Chelatococcus reniformis TaxID=1494448 RepID=A0A916USQ1_9HYPH|nr:LysR substrate-binding domain-containing protein [Chelatococcus reniformis]GGC85483.1 transcriptional regulator [Chelatococcus reniformis]